MQRLRTRRLRHRLQQALEQSSLPDLEDVLDEAKATLSAEDVRYLVNKSMRTPAVAGHHSPEGGEMK